MIGRIAAVVVLILAVGAVGVTLARSGGDAAVSTSPAVGVDEPAAASTVPTTAAPFPEPENFGPRRDLVGLDGWLNTDISSLDELDGQVYVVEMWTFGCHNCKARIPHNQDLYATYKDRGFEIVGVHAPEFSYEAEIPNIEQALIDLGVTWPVAIDTNKRNFRAWQEGGRRFWPRTYVIDQNGDLRYDHIGEGRYQELADTVGWLLDNPPAPAT